MAAIWRFYVHHLGKRPVTTKCVTTGTIIGAGDVLSTYITGNDWQPRRTALMSLYGGMVLAPYSHYWFQILNRFIPLAQKTNKLPWLLASVALDQTIAFPISIGMFMVARGLVDRKSPPEIKDMVKHHFWEAYTDGVKIWGTAQLANFYFVPLEHRVNFLNIVSLAWNTILAVRTSHRHPAPSAVSAGPPASTRAKAS